MNIGRMKWIDQHIGWLLCISLDTLEMVKAFFFRRKKTDIGHPRKIVLSKYFGMGSIILSEPLCSALRRSFPDASIEILTFDSNRTFCESIGLFDKVITIRENNLFLFSLDTIKSLYYFRKNKFDLFLDLEFYSKYSTLISYLSRAKVGVGFYLRALYRGNLLTHQVYYNHYMHISRIFLAFAEAVGIEVDGPLQVPRIQLDREVNALVGDVRRKLDIKSMDRIVLMNPNASELSHERRLPMESFRNISRMILSESGNIKLILIGAEREREYTSELEHNIGANGNLINSAGVLDIRELLALISISQLMITNDSGPLHMAASLGVPTVSFFGPETPLLYGPIGKNHEVFFTGRYCSPCMSVYNVKTANCSLNPAPCMKEISTDEILHTVRLKLSENL